jgi:hypothetical protein
MRMSNCQKAQERRLKLSQGEKFRETIAGELSRRHWDRVRIHDTGDFYSQQYLDDWRWIMGQTPDKQFFAYTKNVPLFKKQDDLPANLHVVYSLGGRWDFMVDLDKDWHSRIFENEEEAKKAGYQPSPNEFPLSMNVAVTREALIYHGNKSWATATGGSAPKNGGSK